MFGGTHQALKELDPRPLSRPELCDLITDLSACDRGSMNG